jgi:hypothetical protein
MDIYEATESKKRKFRMPEKLLPFVVIVVVLIIVLALVAVALLPTILINLR